MHALWPLVLCLFVLLLSVSSGGDELSPSLALHMLQRHCERADDGCRAFSCDYYMVCECVCM